MSVFDSCKNGDIELTKALISEGVSDWQHDGICGASEGGHLELLQYMISISRRSTKNDLDWALCHACFGGHTTVVDFL